MKYLKYHALGNDYIVLRSDSFRGELTPDIVRLICHLNFGVGSDGILYGPLIENDPMFPNRTNVQFMEVIDRAHIKIEIWERGAGYTLASGSSSTAAAAVAYKLGLCNSDITVHMPGGDIRVRFNNGFFATITGPVTKVCEGVMADEMFAETFRQLAQSGAD